MPVRRDRFRGSNALRKKGLIHLMAFVLAFAVIFGIAVQTAYQRWESQSVASSRSQN
jgi:hypothetical protein